MRKIPTPQPLLRSTRWHEISLSLGERQHFLLLLLLQLRLSALPVGDYLVQAVLNRYETYHLADGRVLKLPPDQGEGQHWAEKPGNLYSRPIHLHVDPAHPVRSGRPAGVGRRRGAQARAQAVTVGCRARPGARERRPAAGA